MPLDDSARARVLGGVDQNIDAPAVLLGELGYRLRVGHIERYDLDTFDLAQRLHAGERLPRVGDTNKQDGRSRRRERFRHRLADRISAVGDQHAAIFRITGHFAQLGIVLHVGCRGIRKGKHHGSATLVELQTEPHAGAFDRIAMQMRNDQRAHVEFHGT